MDLQGRPLPQQIHQLSVYYTTFWLLRAEDADLGSNASRM
jgi:hypothetical protein